MSTALSSLSAAELRILFGALPEAVLTVDDSGNVRFLNRAAERLTGPTAEAAVRPIGEVRPLASESDNSPLEHCSTTEAVRIANEVRQAISDHEFTCQGGCHHVGASTGIVPLEGGSSLPDQLLQAADSACYHATCAGGNRVQLQGVVTRSLSGRD